MPVSPHFAHGKGKSSHFSSQLLGERTGRPFGLCEIFSARMKNLVDPIELRLDQGSCLHRCSAILSIFHTIRGRRNAHVEGATEHMRWGQGLRGSVLPQKLPALL